MLGQGPCDLNTDIQNWPQGRESLRNLLSNLDIYGVGFGLHLAGLYNLHHGEQQRGQTAR